jgi:hypothetical protein
MVSLAELEQTGKFKEIRKKTPAMRSLARSFNRSVTETKSVRELTGIVKNKGYRKFTKDNATRVENNQYFYTNDEGHLVQRYPGDENWLIYYEVEYFDHRDEPMSSRLMANAETRRAGSERPRRFSLFQRVAARPTI